MINVAYTSVDAISQQRLAQRHPDFDPPAYRERLARMRSDSARSRSRAGLWLLNQLLMARGEPEDSVDHIGFSASGQPFIAGAPAFSISHSESLVACAIRDDGAIGLDVEYRRMRDMARMARLLDESEQHHVATEPQAFFDYWCAREATVKASGRVGLKRIRALTLADDTACLDARTWWLRPLTLAQGYAACLSSDQAFGEIAISDLSDRLAENKDP